MFEVFVKFKAWCAKVENQTGRKIKVLRTNNGTEFKNSKFGQFCNEHNIQRHYTVKKTPQQNGVAERMNHTIIDRVRCLRLNVDLSKKNWTEVMSTVIYLMTKSLNSTLYEKLVFKRPFYANFLCFCFKSFDVVVWSSVARWNLMGIIECVMGGLADRLLFIWSNCTDTGFKTLERGEKPLFLNELRKLWDERRSFSEKNTLLVDYKPLLNPPNTGIFPSPYDVSQTEDAELGPDGEMRTFLEGLAAAETEVPSYVASHRLGQEPITAVHPDWKFYSRVLRSAGASSTRPSAEPPTRQGFHNVGDYNLNKIIHYSTNYT
ncbi:unnamed protein product [Spirodela intermedia]|uniref:Integrase catalytic domain-containing protein n=1 Tax=Spirodela intermedia TaxID=51605 RepID=A0A7I8LFE2_SPIIN|nr:unnamed protein product [Spirodela intermedia]